MIFKLKAERRNGDNRFDGCHLFGIGKNDVNVYRLEYVPITGGYKVFRRLPDGFEDLTISICSVGEIERYIRSGNYMLKAKE